MLFYLPVSSCQFGNCRQPGSGTVSTNPILGQDKSHWLWGRGG
ncbi:rCG61228, partial [Rattus norvegicus]